MGGATKGSSSRERILAALVSSGEGLTRQELAIAADIPVTSLAALLHDDELFGGLVAEEKAHRGGSGGGPRPKLVRLREGICVAGVEIGHGHVRIAIAGLDGRLWPDSSGRLFEQAVMPVFRERRKTLNWIGGGADGSLGALSRRLSETFACRPRLGGSPSLEKPLVLGVGISVAGPVDPNDGRLVCVRPADGLILREEEGSIACGDWDGESAGQGLRDRLRASDDVELHGWNLTHFRSDSAAELCACAELRDGELSDADFAVLVKWTGNVSAAVVLGGKIVAGSRGLAGGLPLHQVDDRRDGSSDAGGPDHYRLPLGVAAGIRRLSAEIGEEAGLRKRGPQDLLRDYFRSQIRSVARGEQGTPSQAETASRRLSEAAGLLGWNLAPTVDMLDLSKVVIGGGMFERRDWSLVAEPLLEGIRARVAVPAKAPAVAMARHQDHPALDGAIAARLDVDQLASTLERACRQDNAAGVLAPS